MDFWEASEPPHPRHSTHHRPRHHKPHNKKNTYEIPDDRLRPKHIRKPHGGNLNLEESNGASRPQTRFDVVEDWLERTGTARQNPHPRSSTSQRYGKEVAGNSCPSRPLDATSPYNKHPRRVDPRWSPRHGFPSDSLRQSGHRSPNLDLGDPRSTRNRAAPSDSSFISGFENSTKPPDYHPDSIQQDRDEMPSAKARRDVRAWPLEASSATSQINERLNFEKRPRRKTREDKYETKRKRRTFESEDATGRGGHRTKKRRKTERRKHMASSRNVVNNFTSDAVLNERITVQPHLKPGLFDNGRASKKHPISDLTFSEMEFLKHQKRHPPPKALSKSRLREKQREDREMEEVSSFFLPPRAEGKNPEIKSYSPEIWNDHRGLEHLGGQLTSTRRQEPPGPPPPSHRVRPEYNRIPRSHDDTIDNRSLNHYESTDGGMESGKDTTYFTWSSSGHSLQPGERDNDSAPGVSDLTRTATPESVRRKLIATGIYRDSGIPIYDDRSSEQNMQRTIDTAPNGRCVEAENDHRGRCHDFNMTKRVKYRDQAIMTDDLPTPPPNVQVTENHQALNPQLESNAQMSGVPQEIDRHQIVREVRLVPTKNSGSCQNERAPRLLSAETVTSRSGPKAMSMDANQSIESRARQESEQASIASRDMMPPPPIPPGKKCPIMMTPNEEVVSPGRSASSANMREECPQVPRTINCNKDTQGSQEVSGSSNPVDSSPGLTINNEHPLSSLDAASWIPQWTPSARIVENQSTLPRPSLSPIYVNQYEGKSSGHPYPGGLRKLHVPESMAEFIARIESESQLQSPPCDGDNPDAGSGLVEAMTDPPRHDTEQLYDQPLPYYGGRMVHNLTLDSGPSLPGTPNSKIDHHKEEFNIEDTSPLQYGEDTPRVLSSVTRPLEDFEEERFEMVGFWRPNQFSQF